MTKSCLVLQKSLLVLLKLVAHLNLNRSCLVELSRLLVKLALERLKLLLLSGQSFFGFLSLCLKLFSSLALVVDVVLELLKIPGSSLKLLGRFCMILRQLDLLLLRLDLTDLSIRDLFVVGRDLLLYRIDLGPLRTKLLTTNFHDLVLQSLDLILHAGCFPVKSFDLL